MTTLKPCPFCGGESLLRDRYINGVANTKHYIRECRHCKATFAHWFRSVKKADAAWNRRSQQENEPPYVYFTECVDNELGTVWRCSSCGGEMFGDIPAYCSRCGKKLERSEE